tara:strand:- start:378 stop:749 length:372 start_codon:yes stop_codon:yes gene_type:complete
MYYIVDKYNSKLSFDKKDNLIKKYNLKYIDQFKKYIIQNIEIVSNKNSIQFYKLKDKQIINNLEVYKINKFIPFSFFKIDKNEYYKLYTNTINDVKILMKIYDNYINIEYLTEELNNLELINK